MDSYDTNLIELADIGVGYQARGRIEKNTDGDFSIIRPQDFDEAGALFIKDVMRFSPTIDPEKYLVNTGDILIQARGHKHLAYLINEPLENTVVANTFYILRIKDLDRVSPAYLVWWINQPVVQSFFKQEQGISTIPFISKTVMVKAPVLIPPLETQEKIIDLLWLWQQEQGLIRKLIQKKDILIQGVARNAAARFMEEH